MKKKEIQKIIQEKVIGVWEARHTSSGHFYYNTKTGYTQASVTSKMGGTLSKPHLLKWAIRIGVEWLEVDDRWQRFIDKRGLWREEMLSGAQLAHTDVRDDAGFVGTQAHDAIERYLNDWIASNERPENIKDYALPNYDPRAIAAMRAVEEFFKKHNIEPIASELLVGSDKISAGTLDFLCFMDGKLSLLDWKTSNAVDAISYSMQVAAYKYFFEEMTGLRIKQCKILHLSKDASKFEIYKVLEIPNAWKAFKAVCIVFDWINASGKKVEKDIKRLKI